ncbi:uncharacterized protein EDB91DRAFT_1133483 [Suillus paluster]|uniref:uncharacterized protein n=1 Tax=Suillus paluster TaxID=48578 RepID=UPI001B86CD29|nr:uncharacterized protein EDB91DRAFT_1133483 [Suillus paluster]KAG1740177.1 hypothetical protein EDB91DRAFT_1133483 [Suillus paluster]
MAGIGITLDTAAVISTVMEGILYGFSVLMFMGTIWTLTHKRRMKDVNRPIVVVAILLLVLSTAHMVVDIIRIELGLVTYRDTFPGGPAAFFADITQATCLIKSAIYIFQTIVSDGMLIYRCYIIWQSIWVIIFPSMLLFGITASGIYAVYNASQATSDAGNVYAKGTGPWIIAYYAMTLTTNLWASALLAYRIWIARKIPTTKSTTKSIVRMLVEAAILYSIALLSLLVGFVLQNNGHYILLDMIMPIISITFYTVLIRIAIKNGAPDHLPTVRGSTGSETTRRNSRHHPTRPLQVHISRHTHNDGALRYGTEQDLSPTKAESVTELSCAV